MLQRLALYDTPKSPSWLNLVEIEMNELRTQGLDRWISERNRLVSEFNARENQRNENGARVKLMVTTERPRLKLTCVIWTPPKSQNLRPSPQTGWWCHGVCSHGSSCRICRV